MVLLCEVKLFVFEDISIGISKLENGTIIRHQELLSVGVTLSPFIEDDLLHENVALKDRLDRNILVDQLRKIILEQVGRDVVVLVLHDMLDHAIHSVYLVAFQCTIDSCPVKEFL